VDARFGREFDLQLRTPAADLIHTPDSVVTDRFYDALHGLIEDHENTLVFANSRSGAERTLRELRERFGYDESDSGCHHGSLGEAQRTRIEEGLKAGTLDVVTTSTSLELGIDMPHLDLVVQVGSPKSVAALLQRVGRAGHSPGETVEGGCSRSTATSWSSECAAMLARAEEGFVDGVSLPELPTWPPNTSTGWRSIRSAPTGRSAKFSGARTRTASSGPASTSDSCGTSPATTRGWRSGTSTRRCGAMRTTRRTANTTTRSIRSGRRSSGSAAGSRGSST